MSTQSPPWFALRLLGAPSVRTQADSGATAIQLQPRRLALLAFLVLARPRGLHSRDSLLALLWPEVNQRDGRRALRNVLYGIRQALDARVIVTVGDALVGVDPSIVSCDVFELEEDIAQSRLDRIEGMRDRELMQGFHVSAAPGFERWLDGERERLLRSLTRGAAQVGEDCRMRGDPNGAVNAFRIVNLLEPDDERTLRRLVEAYEAAGDRRAAVLAFDGFVARLRDEHGSAPAPETAALGVQLRSRRGAARMVSHGPDMLCVRGTYLFLRAAHGGHAEDLERSLAFFEQALAIDPAHAAAWAGLSNYFAAAAARNLLRPFEEHFGRAIELATKAIFLDETLAVPHVHFGVKAMYLDDDWERAGAEFSRAVALDPHYAEGRRFLGVYLGVMGKGDDAIAHLLETVRTEPHLAIFRNSLADAYMQQGAYETAIAELRSALEADVRYSAARERLVRCFERLGRHAEAVAERRFMGAAGRAGRFQLALDAEGEAGYRRERELELRDTIKRLEASLREGPPQHAGDRFSPPQLRLALACAELGDREGARQWEEHACRSRPGRRQWFASRPELRPT